MSRNHVIVEGLESSFRIRDVGSSNGTYVNDFQISTVDLCAGDEIRVGTSVFQVEMTDVELGAMQASQSSPPTKVDESEDTVPSRSLSSLGLNSLGFKLNEEPTQFFDPSSPHLPLQDQNAERGPGLVPRSESHVPIERVASAPTVAEPESGLASKRSDEGSRSSDNSQDTTAAFYAQFEQEGSGKFWRKRGEIELSEVLETVQNIDPKLHLSLVVNLDQLAADELGTLEFTFTTRESRPLSGRLCLFQNAKRDMVVDLFGRSLGRDAAICIASKRPLSLDWTRNAAESLSYPSMFFGLLQNANAAAAELVREVEFLMLEASSAGPIYLVKRRR